MKFVDKGVEDMSEGTWKVTHARGDTANVRIEWPDDAPETMTVRFSGRQMRIELQSGEKLTFRAALKTTSGF